MTEPRWGRGMGTDDERWALGWQSGAGQGYAVLRYQGTRLRRGVPGGHRRRRRGHAADGLWLPALVLLLFVNAHFAWVVLLVLLVVGVVISTAVGSALGDSPRVADGSGGVLPRHTPAVPGAFDPAGAPYRLSAGALAAVDGHDLYRMRLLDVLKERYVKGQISLDDFEARATRIARDPSARHLD